MVLVSPHQTLNNRNLFFPFMKNNLCYPWTNKIRTLIWMGHLIVYFLDHFKLIWLLMSNNNLWLQLWVGSNNVIFIVCGFGGCGNVLLCTAVIPSWLQLNSYLFNNQSMIIKSNKVIVIYYHYLIDLIESPLKFWNVT